MAQYTLIDPATGRQTTLSEVELTRNLQIGCILLRDGEHIGIITHRDLVAFARWCAGKMLARLVDEPDLKVTHTLTMVDQWLEDQQSVTPEELKAAADAAWAARTAEAAAWTAAQAVAGAAWAAARAAWAVEAAWAAAEAARFAAQAAWAAARAAWAAEATEIASYEAQACWLVEHLQSGK